ncbi:nickel pincer cofactor biosynthesis protein LarC [Methanoplanus sp. FWC-SCC4]|uniref:Putative nickel insertion protein n=1 Tax=Methanochimaera problematica TaxID=2609417 RepID=A0AA97FB90_9EURY|nr:nickel pincer cofactor biosynthesis protein LarC [Methanoplanus sp. FWC-SCC4]WOF15717.1 nickel pincer cofactor biosynthesis protein LarC [Methanoplanus sp. FWC-SCC4]
MKILLFDPFHGAAGDMIIGALLDLGADKDSVEKAMSSVVSKPDFKNVERCGISAVKVETNAGKAHRTLDEVNNIIDTCIAPKEAVLMAKRVFGRINTGEINVHGTKMTHFHEVGADDAIADVIGACTAFLSLNPDAVYIKPLALGCGFVNSEHGKIPVPAPATIEILKESGLQVIYGKDPEEGELCTPTGAALLSEFSTYSNTEPEGRIIATGYGAGTKNPQNTPNVLRTLIIEQNNELSDRVDILETNVDDATGEVIAYTIQRLMDEGARDASSIPINMKKGRNGSLIRVICKPEEADMFVRILSEELGTLGIRHIRSIHRSILKRTFETVSLELKGRIYAINVKIGWIETEPVTLKAEYEDAKKCAEETGLPIKKIAAMAERIASEKIDNGAK